MAEKVYAVRILVETDEDIKTVESKVRGWGDASFEGFVLLDLALVKTSLAEVDTLAHTIAVMVRSQARIQESLETVTTAFEKTSKVMQEMIDVEGKADEATDEDNTARLLFTIISTEVAEELDAGIISDKLRQAFENYGITLSAIASVTPLKTKLPTWQISNEGTFYSIRKHDTLLKVYMFPCCICGRSVDISKPSETFHNVPRIGRNTIYCPSCFEKDV